MGQQNEDTAHRRARTSRSGVVLMPSLTHDAFVQLFRNQPRLAPELLRDVLKAPVPAFERVMVGDVTMTEVVPTEYRADLVLLLEGSGAPTAALVLEVQLGRDASKRWSWPVYLAGLRARLRCDTALFVVTDDLAIATWAGKPIPMGHPGWVLTPLVLGPANVPVVVEESVAAKAPELAVLSAMVHGAGPDAAAIGKAALGGARLLDDERARLYADLVFASMHGMARAALEALMANGKYEYQSDFARRYVAQGRAEGHAEGRAEGVALGMASAILHVLAARGIAVPEELRARIRSCTEMSVLETWLARTATAKSASEVIGE